MQGLHGWLGLIHAEASQYIREYSNAGFWIGFWMHRRLASLMLKLASLGASPSASASASTRCEDTQILCCTAMHHRGGANQCHHSWR